MASGTINVTTDNQYISGHISWSSTPDTPNNQSTVTATLYLSRTNTGYTTTGSGTFYITINGTSKSNSQSFSISYNSNTTMVSNSVVVAHNSDGNKSISISCSGGMPGTSLGSTSGSATVTLDTIPRSSTISSFNNFTIGTSFNVSFYCYSTSFSNTLTLDCGGTTVKTITVPTGISGTITQTFSLTQAEYNIILGKIANGGTSVTTTLYLKTYSGGSQIGSTQSDTSTASTSASSITGFSNFNIGTDPAITLSIPLPSFSHSLELKVGSTSIKTGTGSANDNSLSLGLNGTTEINALYNQIASSANSVSVTLYVKTMYGAIQIGATITKSITASAITGTISTFANFTAGSAFSVGLSSTGQTGLNYVLDIKVGSTLITSKTSVSATTSITLTSGENNTLHSSIPNSTTGSVTAYLTTKYGTKVLGSVSSKVATATITATPSVTSITAVETISSIVSLALGTNRFVQNASKIRFNINGAVAGNGATIKSYNISFNGTNYATNTTTTNVINATGSIVATATVTDSRNKVATATVSCTLIAYAPPNISKMTVQRLNASTLLPDVVLGTTAKWVISASVSSVKDGGSVEKNTITYNIYSKLNTDVSYGAVKTTATPSGLSVTDLTGNLTTYLATASYSFYLEVKDKINTSTKTVLLSSGQVTMSWGKTGVGIGKIFEHGALDVLGDFYLEGNMYLTPTKNFKCEPTANAQEWSFDLNNTTYTGAYWQVWSNSKTTLLKAEADTGLVTVPYSLTVGSTLNSSGTVNINKTGDGATLLALNTERGWSFKQTSTGSTSALTLECSSSDKAFNILCVGNSSPMVSFYVSTTVPAINVNAPINLENARQLQGKNTTGSLFNLAQIGSDNFTIFGTSSLPIRLHTNAQPVVNQSGTTYTLAYTNHTHDSVYANVAGDTFTGVVNGTTFSTAGTDGNGFRFWGSDTYKIYMSSSANATLGTRVTGETTSDYNMYFKMTAGTNRGFAFCTGSAPYFGINPNGVWSEVQVTTQSNFYSVAGYNYFSGVRAGNGNELNSSANNLYINYRYGNGLTVCNGDGAGTKGAIYGSTKSAVVNTENYGEVILYCDESPNHVFHDSGHGIIGEDGLCYISLDPVFLETVATKERDYLVYLTGYQGANAEIVDKQSDYFVISGVPNKEFDWLVRAERQGMERLRFVDADIVI